MESQKQKEFIATRNQQSSTPQTNTKKIKSKNNSKNSIYDLRISIRNRFGRFSIKYQKPKQWNLKKRVVQSERKPQTQDTSCDSEKESIGYRGNVKDVAVRFANISKHKVQETFTAAKYILKRKSHKSSNFEGTFDEYYKDYRFSFSESDFEDAVFSPNQEDKQNSLKNKTSNNKSFDKDLDKAGESS